LALLFLSLAIFQASALPLRDPRTVASDPGITGKMALGYCLPYAIALGDVLLQRSGIYSQGITVALYNPVTHQRLGAHIFVSYLDRQGQRWVVDNNRLQPTRVSSDEPLNWAVAVLHRPEMKTSDIHILFITPLPASKPTDKARFAKWMAWYNTPDYKKTIARERHDQQQLGNR
jgi:hypothetical protein